MKYLILLLFCLSNILLANTSVYLSMNSYHYKDLGQNESHELIGLEYNNLYAETFINSYYERSYHIGYIDRNVKCNSINICLGYSAGVVHVYSKYDAPVVPTVVPIVSWTNDNWGIDTVFLYHKAVAIKLRYIF